MTQNREAHIPQILQKIFQQGLHRHRCLLHTVNLPDDQNRHKILKHMVIHFFQVYVIRLHLNQILQELSHQPFLLLIIFSSGLQMVFFF